MSKKVLVLYYSQTGQLKDIVGNFMKPFTAAGITVETVRIRPVHDYDFPWSGKSFFATMPESVLGIPAELEPFQFRENAYDLIVFAYQPWYLSPSIPATSALLHPDVKKILKNTPVITLIGARNMWLNAQEKVKKMLADAGGILKGNIVLADPNTNLVSAVTIVHWMFSGRKDRYLGIFPKPGVPDEKIMEAEKFGDIVLKHMESGDLNRLQEDLAAKGAARVKPDLLFIEKKAKRIFSVWANLVIRRKNRDAWLVLFKYYLIVALFFVSPILLVINSIFFRPFSGKSILREKQYYSGVN